MIADVLLALGHYAMKLRLICHNLNYPLNYNWQKLPVSLTILNIMTNTNRTVGKWGLSCKTLSVSFCYSQGTGTSYSKYWSWFFKLSLPKLSRNTMWQYTNIFAFIPSQQGNVLLCCLAYLVDLPSRKLCPVRMHVSDFQASFMLL